MSVIRQTNRTILFEEFNPDKYDLLTLLSDTSSLNSLDDDKIEEINGHLLVRSFHEFMEKFSPVIYAFYDSNNHGMVFSLVKPHMDERLIQVVALNEEHDLIRMFLDLMDARKNSDEYLQLFNFERILDFISPHKKIEELKILQGEFLQEFQQYYALYGRGDKDMGETSKQDESSRITGYEQEHEKAKKRLSVLLDKAVSDYYSVMSLIPIVLEDMRKKLMPEEKVIKIWNPIISGMQNMKEEDIRIVDIPKTGSVSADDIEKDSQNFLKEMITSHYRKHSELVNTYVEELILRSYGLAPQGDIYDLNTEDMVEQYNQYLTFYVDAKDRFIQIAKPYVEKILGVKAFFEQYDVKKSVMGMELIVTNVDNEMWVKLTNEDRLKAYMNTVNTKIDFENTIWFALLPTITFPPDKVKKLSRERFKGNEMRNILRANSIEMAGHIMALCSRYGIQTFFSYETDDTTTFSYTAENGIDHFVDGSRPFLRKDWSEFAIPCFPNFTIVPKGKSYIAVGSRLIVTEENKAAYSKDKKDFYKLWIGGVHIEAAFVAAGLVAAYQCPGYLGERFRKDTVKDLPGVRYNIEDDKNMLNTVTTMSKETSGYKEEVLEKTKDRKFGFFFASETYYLGKKRISGITVRCARSLRSVDDIYEPIYKVLVTNYIERVFRYDTFDFKKPEIVRFFQNHPNNRRSYWLLNRKKINGILREHDDLQYKLDETSDICELDITLDGVVSSSEFSIDAPASGGE